jgi:hypothetical protein
MQPNEVPPPGISERRGRQPRLRELVDTLLEVVRDLSVRIEDLSADEVEGTRIRFNATGELIWAAILSEVRAKRRSS